MLFCYSVPRGGVYGDPRVGLPRGAIDRTGGSFLLSGGANRVYSYIHTGDIHLMSRIANGVRFMHYGACGYRDYKVTGGVGVRRGLGRFLRSYSFVQV